MYPEPQQQKPVILERITGILVLVVILLITSLTIVIGYVLNTVWDFKDLIRDQLIDYVRGAVTHMGGITPLKKTLEYAAQYQIKSGMHGPTDISPHGHRR